MNRTADSSGKGRCAMRIYRFMTCAALAALVSGCAGFATKEEHAELRKKVDELRGNLADTNAKLEELNNKSSLLREKFEEQRAKVDRLSSSPSVPAGLKVVTLGETGASRSAEEALPKRSQLPLGPEPAAPAKAAAAKSAPEGFNQGKEPQRDPVALYNRGQDLFMAGKFNEAREVFSGITDSFPSSTLADNALYWIGESYYSERDFEKALEKFRQTAQLYPNENKAPDALLKAGLTLMEMNAPDKAKEEFEALVKRYPDSEAAVAAQKILKKVFGKTQTK